MERRCLLSATTQAGADKPDPFYHAEVDFPFGVFTPEEIASLESIPVNSSFSTKTPSLAREDGSHESNILTFVLDFKETGQGSTFDIFNNEITTFDITAYGFAASDFETVTNAILAEIEEDYFTELVGTVAGPPGQDLRVDFIIGDIGTAPVGVSEYYYVQIGTGVSGPHSGGTLGVAGGSVVRNSSGSGPNSGIEVGDVVCSVFTDAIRTLGGLSPSNALSSGNITYTTFAVGGTLSHEIGHTLSLSHINKAGSVQPTPGLSPLMGTGAIDLPNQDRIGDREFSLSGFDGEAGNAPRQHIQQLVNAVGLHSFPAGGIDLRGTSFTISPSNLAGAGGLASASFTVANGLTDAAGAFDVKFFLSDDATIDPGTDILLTLDPTDPNYDPSEPSAYHVAGLAGAGSHSNTINLAVPTDDPFGTDESYYIGVVVDADDEVVENDEANNLNRGPGLDGDDVTYITGFVNTTTINIPGTSTSGPGSPYPSNINVSGLSGTVTDVNVRLYGLAHTWPDDIDILLVGPSGQKVMLASDMGGSSPISGVNLVLDDAAVSALPDGGPLFSGTYRPADYLPGDSLPSPAPFGPYSTLLSVFNDTNPNGTWSLYIGDDASSDAGALVGGWEIEIAVGSPPEDDAYEENDTLETAYDLSLLEQTYLSEILGSGIQSDDDWYKIEVTPGFEHVQIEALFTHAEGDIDIALYDSSGNLWAVSNDIVDNEFINVTVPSSGTYYILVYYEDAGNEYDLWWDDVPPVQVAIDPLVTTDSTPELTGTVSHPSASITVDVADQIGLVAINNGDGTWTLPDNTLAALANGTYDVVVIAADGANVGFDTTVDELTIDEIGLPGDYNDDGIVDTADYVLFRKYENTDTILPNDLIGGTIGQQQYDQWKSHFGQTAPGGGSGDSQAEAVFDGGLTASRHAVFASVAARREQIIKGEAPGVAGIVAIGDAADIRTNAADESWTKAAALAGLRLAPSLTVSLGQDVSGFRQLSEAFVEGGNRDAALVDWVATRSSGDLKSPGAPAMAGSAQQDFDESELGALDSAFEKLLAYVA